ncbi:S-methyl-5'-thioinosine phosphorylase [Neisseria leonii]|uniref:S-methyl-5'-thioinosine phosphorylase n=1 Tax=Neisseria leonii TaxID=2995413 RepID=UPI00237A9CBD|nr:S-methyl-5'-thioinosine phosphorylase [Neisseria sp. 3986]MDD9326129.1 S-methyl-5'-thioinosine phosphorylase [Neisseria sp. 3986]
MFAVIGGSGLTRIPELEITHRQIIRTPYGLPSAPVLTGRLGSRQILFLARHGLAHTLAPHEINYRANIWALKEAGADGIIAISAVTALRADLTAGSLVLPDDLIDYTSGRADTFFEGGNAAVRHTDFSEPYDAALRAALLDLGQKHDTPILSSAVYGCLPGPRTATRAEMRRFTRDGVDVIGMTGMPEAVLARELDLPYAHLCGVVCCAGSSTGNTHQRDMQSHSAIGQIRRLLKDW